MSTALVSIGLTWVWIVPANSDGSGLTNWQLLVPLLLAGIGSGPFIAPNADFIIATVDRTDAGAASGVINVSPRVGSAVRIAVIGSVLFGSLSITGGHPWRSPQASRTARPCPSRSYSSSPCRRKSFPIAADHPPGSLPHCPGQPWVHRGGPEP